MKCAYCDNNLLASDIICDKCNKLILQCDACKELICEDDVFCGYCGFNVEKIIERQKKEHQQELEEFLEKEKTKKLEEQMNLFANNIIVECEGNKFKAIKLFKEKFSVDNEEATSYINKAFSKIEKVEETMNGNINEEPIEISVKEPVDPKGIKKTIIVASSSRKKATSAIGRGLIGGALLGPIGLLAGTTAKTKDTTTFLIIYNSGKQETVTVKNGGWMFNQYCKYLEK